MSTRCSAALAGSHAAQPLDEWMKTMRFASEKDGARTGLSPLKFAVLSDRVDLAAELIARGANVRSKLKRSDREYGLEAPFAICTAR